MSEADAASQTTDAVLVLRSQRGDRASFEQLVRRTARLVWGRLYLETGSADRAEDLVQETYLVAWRSIKQVTDPSGFRAWLLSVAHSVAVDAARHDARRKRSGVRADATAMESLVHPAPEPPESAERNEARRDVLAVLQSLPEEYRLVLMLRYLAGADYQEIATQLRLSNGSLRGRLNRGMAMMREKMKDDDAG